jgi:signal transduction histidine kinase
MDVKIYHLFRRFLYFCLLFGAAILYISNAGKLNILALYALFAATILFHIRLYYPNNSGARWQSMAVIAAAFGLALIIQYYDAGPMAGFYVILLLVYVILVYQASFSVPFSIIAFLCHIGFLYYMHNSMAFFDFIISIRTVIIPRVVILTLSFVARQIIIISEENRSLTKSLHERNTELQEALDRLSVYSKELEKTAVLRAKDQLMKEIHDKLGHVLATASIGAQAAAILIDQDAADAKRRLGLVAEQIQEAMQTVRNVVTEQDGLLKEGDRNFIGNITKLITETEKLTGISVFKTLSEEEGGAFERLSSAVKSYLYNALMEGITNGLQHGSATVFHFCLCCKKDSVEFSLEDNGSGFQELTDGFGLNKMKKGAGRLNGHFEIRGGQNGCVLTISIPLEW